MANHPSTMDVALTMPEQKRGARNKRRDIPAELVEEILLNLPVKSLIRLSMVSKSWNSVILGAEFIKRYRGREMMVLRAAYSCGKALVCSLSSMSSDNPMDNATPFVRPFKADPYFHTSCDELWCVEFENSLYLYNPSMRTCRKLPDPSSPPKIGSTILGTSVSVFVYGLGYDSASDDYKILKTHRKFYGETELYSLRSDSWRNVSDSCEKVHIRLSSPPPPPLPVELTFLSSKGVFVSGALHWLIRADGADWNFNNAILSFDLLTEEYGKVALPKSVCKIQCGRRLDVTVLRGMLCVYANHRRLASFVVWVMEDCSWTKELEINYAHIHPLCYSHLKPFFFYDSAGNLVKAVTSSTDIRKMFLYKDGSTLVEKNFGTKACGLLDSFTYVESLASLWPRKPRES